MNVYVDSSVLLRVALRQPNPLPAWPRISAGVASELLRVECLRAVDRIRFRAGLDDTTVATLRGQVLAALDHVRLVPIDAHVLARAAEPFTTGIRTLDAIHLASALAAREHFDDLALATHDQELALAARAEGFEVHGAA